MFVIFVFSLILHILVSLILLGLTWHGGGGGGVGILCNYFSANFAIVFFLFSGWRPGFKTFFFVLFSVEFQTLSGVRAVSKRTAADVAEEVFSCSRGGGGGGCFLAKKYLHF